MLTEGDTDRGRRKGLCSYFPFFCKLAVWWERFGSLCVECWKWPRCILGIAGMTSTSSVDPCPVHTASTSLNSADPGNISPFLSIPSQSQYLTSLQEALGKTKLANFAARMVSESVSCRATHAGMRDYREHNTCHVCWLNDFQTQQVFVS